MRPPVLAPLARAVPLPRNDFFDEGGDDKDDSSKATPTERSSTESPAADLSPTNMDHAKENIMMLSNFQDKFLEIIENDEVENDVELNERFLSDHMDIPVEELSSMQKIELRVDTSTHNLQATGEILFSLE